MNHDLFGVVLSCLDRNAEVEAKLLDHSETAVTVSGILAAQVQVERSQKQVYEGRTGPSISEQVQAASLRGQPVDSIEHRIMANPSAALAGDSSIRCNGWSFSQVTSTACSACSTRGEVHCSACGGGGNSFCFICMGKGKKSCFSCGGSGVHAPHPTSTAQSCGACFGTGRKNCHVCSGAGRAPCPSCAGKGLKACEPCAGQGYMHTESAESYVAELQVQSFTCTAALQSAQVFVEKFWSSLAARGHALVNLSSTEQRKAMSAQWIWKGLVKTKSITVELAGKTFELNGSVKAGDIVWAADTPFLGDLLKLPDSNTRKAQKDIYEKISDTRIRQECQEAANKAQIAGEDYLAAVRAMLTNVYGAALLPEQRELIAKAAFDGLDRMRRQIRRRAWLGFLPYMVFVAAILMFGADVIDRFSLDARLSDWLQTSGFYFYPSDGFAIIAAAGLTLLFILVGVANVRGKIRRVGGKLGLSNALAPKQGVWVIGGPILAFFAGILGWFIALFTIMVLSTYTLLYPDDEQMGLFEGPVVEHFIPYLPALVHLNTQRSLYVYEYAHHNTPIDSHRMIPVGTELRVLGLPRYGKSPVLTSDNKFFWVETYFLPGAPGRDRILRTMTTTAAIRLRRTPSTTGNNVLFSIPEQQQVTLLGYTTSGWERIVYEDRIGWVFSEYLCCESAH